MQRKLPCRETTELLASVESHLRSQRFELSVREAGRLLERVLREMYQTIYFSVTQPERLLIQKPEEEIGKGTKGVNVFTLGEMVRLYREAKFQKSWQCHFRVEPLLFSGVDLGAIVSARNRCVHPDVNVEYSVNPSQAELCVSILKSFLVATGYVQEHVKEYVNMYKSTKGLRFGDQSFDDRASVKLVINRSGS